jgi:hypothetical protein
LQPVTHPSEHCSHLEDIDLTCAFIEQAKGLVDSAKVLRQLCHEQAIIIYHLQTSC